jgi:hypothetical protein
LIILIKKKSACKFFLNYAEKSRIFPLEFSGYHTFFNKLITLLILHKKLITLVLMAITRELEILFATDIVIGVQFFQTIRSFNS